MAVTLYRTFAPLTKLPADWPNAVAGFLAGLSNINLVAKTATSVAISGATQPRSVMSVDGIWRWSEGDVEATVPAGAATTYDCVVWCTANKFKAAVSESEGETDETNYSLHLEVRAHETLPAIAGEVAAAQKIGEVDWDGAKIVALRQTVGHLRSTDPTEPTMPLVSVPAVIEKGIASPVTAIRKTEANAEANTAWEVLVGGISKLKVLASGLIEGLSLPAESIPESWLKALAVGTAKIANGAVTAAKLGAEAVETGKIKLEAITTPLLANLGVTTPKIGEEAVTTIKIAQAAIVPSRVASEVLWSPWANATLATGVTSVGEQVVGSRYELTAFTEAHGTIPGNVRIRGAISVSSEKAAGSLLMTLQNHVPATVELQIGSIQVNVVKSTVGSPGTAEVKAASVVPAGATIRFDGVTFSYS